jgi:hypothetical protein
MSDTSKVPRGRPAFADTQRDKILELLREAGPRGVRREDLLYVRRWSQAGTRIHELEQQGYVIEHFLEPGQRFVTYRLVSEPASEKPLPNFERKQSEGSQAAFCESSGDWYTRTTGRARPQLPQQKFLDLPLFRNSGQR